MIEQIPDSNLPNHIVPLILNSLRDHLERELVDGVPENNPTRAVLVKNGRFQDNPLDKNVSVAISSGNADDPDFKDGRVDHEALDEIVIRNIPVGEIGGGEYWWRRFTIKYHCFFVRQRYDEDRAMAYAFDFQGRLKKALKEAPISGIVDDYGEGALNWPIIESATYFESGGTSKYIWRGQFFFRILTWQQ